MKRYECDPLVIDIVEKLYKGDRTEVYLGSEKLFKIEVTSGIRQGCTLSPILFIMVVNLIIRRVQKSKLGFRSSEVYIPVLFYADDGLILSNERGEIEEILRIVREVAKETGLEISKLKSECLILNKRDEPGKI